MKSHVPVRRFKERSLRRPRWHALCLPGFAALLALSAGAQRSPVSDAVRSTVTGLFQALEAGDSSALRTLLLPGARLLALDEHARLRTADLHHVAGGARRTENPETVTRRSETRLRIDGGVAHFWLEYSVIMDGRAAYCGLEIVDLFDVAGAWKVLALTRTRSERGCVVLRGDIASSAPANRRASPPDTADLRERARRAEVAFLLQWHRAWLLTEVERDPWLAQVTPRPPRPLSDPFPAGRVKAAHCHFPTDVLQSAEITPSAHSKFSVCATWYAGEGLPPADERVARDDAISPSVRADLADARRAVLALFDSGAVALPRDHFIVGQRVRLRVDAGDVRAALQVARDCRADGWWCTALLGYALYHNGDAREADSVFLDMTAMLAPATRCAWIDARELLEPAARRDYGELSCAARDSVTRRLWWLADPFLRESWNERRAEHFARKVLVLLHTSLERNEHHMLPRQLGGDAVVDVISRYGWPSYFGWAGASNDASHTTWLGNRTLDPYTSFEYTRNRVHTVPTWAAVLDPFSAPPNAWSLTAPNARAEWWPYEHFAPARPFVQLPEHQLALLRRDDQVLLAVAADLPSSALARRDSDSIPDAQLLASAHPDTITRVATGNGVVGTSLVLSGLVAPRPMLVGVEFLADSANKPGARTRFGVPSGPLALSELAPGAIAVSDPVLLRAPSGGEPLPNNADDALKLMHGSTRLRGVAQVGIYWEMYGLAPTDSVDVAVWIERFTRQGAFRRLGIALDMARDLNTPVIASWSQPQASRGASIIAGRASILGRSIRLDVSTLPRGEYWVDIEVRKRGAEPVRGRRVFVVE